MRRLHETLGTSSLAIEFAEEHRIDLGRDIALVNHNARPYLAVHSNGSVFEDISDDGGTDYEFVRIDYAYPISGDIGASRMVAVIKPGKRTELAYWSADAEPKDLTVHKGSGHLIVNNPVFGLNVALYVDADTSPEVTLPSGNFYTIKAEAGTEVPLVVSGFYSPPLEEWSSVECEVAPRSSFIVGPGASEGIIRVPRVFGQL